MPLDPGRGSSSSGFDDEFTPLLFPALRPVNGNKDPHFEGSSTDEGPFFHFKSPSRGQSTFKQFGSTSVKTHPSCRRYLGILLAILASFLLSLTTLIARLLIEYHPLNEALWRFFGILVPSIPILFLESLGGKGPTVFQTVYPFWEGEKLKTLLVICIRAVCGCTAVIFQFYALSYIEIGDVTVISFTTPVFVSVLAYFLLGEKLGILPIIFALVTLVGIGIIARPPILSGAESFDPSNLIGIALALGCMVFASFTYITLRWLKPVHYALVTFFYGLISVIGCGVCALATGVVQLPVGTEHWLLAVGLGGLAFAGQSLFTLALKFEDAGPIALIRTCEVIFTFLWQIMFLDQLPDAFSAIGATLILLSVLATAFRKLLMELPDDNPVKSRFPFLLK